VQVGCDARRQSRFLLDRRVTTKQARELGHRLGLGLGMGSSRRDPPQEEVQVDLNPSTDRPTGSLDFRFLLITEGVAQDIMEEGEQIARVHKATEKGIHTIHCQLMRTKCTE
jgi:hypothetical protein